jgi:hypothetical protein
MSLIQVWAKFEKKLCQQTRHATNQVYQGRDDHGFSLISTIVLSSVETVNSTSQ